MYKPKLIADNGLHASEDYPSDLSEEIIESVILKTAKTIKNSPKQ